MEYEGDFICGCSHPADNYWLKNMEEDMGKKICLKLD